MSGFAPAGKPPAGNHSVCSVLPTPESIDGKWIIWGGGKVREGKEGLEEDEEDDDGVWF